MSSPQTSTLEVTIVAADERLDAGLANFLRQQGVTVTRTSDVDTCMYGIPRGGAVLVLFPDDFRLDQVVGLLFAQQRERPDIHVALVTHDPERYAEVVVGADHAPAPTIIHERTHAWNILHTARAHAARFWSSSASKP